MTTSATRVRATTADALLVARRRAAQDVGLLGGTTLLLLAALLLALALPRLVDRAADTAARAAVERAGTAADLVADPGGSVVGDVLGPAAATAGWLAAELPTGLGPCSASARTSTFLADAPDGSRFFTRLAVVVPLEDADRDDGLVRWVAGTAPAPVPAELQVGPERPDLPGRVEVGMSAAAARTLGVTVDDGPFVVERGRTARGPESLLVVTGLYEPLDRDHTAWRDLPELVDVVPVTAASDVDTLAGLYVPVGVLEDLATVVPPQTLQTTVRVTVDTTGTTLDELRALRRTVLHVTATSGRVSTDLPAVLDAFEDRLVAARAQASLTVVGIAATAALCLVLAGGLLAGRRRPLLAAERARGASLASVVVRALVETVPLVVVTAVVAVAVVLVALPGAHGTVAVAAAVAAVAVLAPAVLAAHAAAAAWTRRRVPTDADERAHAATVRSLRRVTAELLVVVVAVAAVVSVRRRGLVPVGDGDVDPLLAAAPVLVAAAAALVVVRVAPAAVRAAGRLAARSRGLAAPLAVARAHGAATAVTPLLAVTVAVALVVLSGTLVQSVRSGQRDAADLRVGGDVRLDGRLDRELGRAALAALPDAAGVDALASGSQLPGRTVGSGLGLTATLLVVDAAELARVRADRGLPVDAGLAALGTPDADGAVPALVSAGLLERLSAHPVQDDLRIGVLGEPVTVDVRGTTAMLPDAGAPPLDARAAAPARTEDDGLVVADRDVLVATGVDVPAPDRAWLSGSGAVAAVAALGLPPASASGITVTTHDGWSRAWTGDPLTAALQGLLAAGVGVLALLLVLTLVLVVVATSRERGRTLSTLRTLGLDARTARAATLGELAPLVLGGLLGGTVIGLVVPWLVTDALGLPWLTGDPRGGHVVPVAWPVLVAAAALLAALVVAVGTEQLVRRRDRLGDVLRVGER